MCRHLGNFRTLPSLLPEVVSAFLKKKKRFIYYFIYFWLLQVLVAARGIFVEACGLFVAAHRLLSSCGVQVFLSLVVSHRFQSTWAL